MFYRAQCWASMLGSTMRLAALDSVLVTAARMAFRLERNTSTEASLALVGLEPSRCHILRRLVRYLVQKHKTDLETFSGNQTQSNRVTPLEWGATWFQRLVQGKTLLNPLTHRRHIIYRGIDRALKAEWSRRWTSSEIGSALWEVLPEVGEAWTTRDARSGSRTNLPWMAQFRVRHCDVGAFPLPWSADE